MMTEDWEADWETKAHERHCVHCSREVAGRVFPARDYLRRLQGLKGAEAARVAGRVGPFYWSDADVMHIRLCDACAASLGLEAAESSAPAVSGVEHETARAAL